MFKNFSFYALSALLLTLASCKSADTPNGVPTPNTSSPTEGVYLGHFSLSPSLRATETSDVKTLSFYSDSDSKGLSLDVYIIRPNELFGYDADLDGSIDFYAKLTDNRLEHVIYLDSNQKELREFTVTMISDYEVRFDPIGAYKPAPNLRGLFGGNESLKDCFERRMGSAHGLLMAAAANLIGPEGPLAVCAGAALSCAIWTPN